LIKVTDIKRRSIFNDEKGNKNFTKDEEFNLKIPSPKQSPFKKRTKKIIIETDRPHEFAKGKGRNHKSKT